MDISQILELQNWLFFAKRQPYYYLLDGGCAQERSLSHASIIPFCHRLTADNLNYAQTKRDAQKTNYNMYLHLLQAHVDPRSTLCNWLFNGQFENENSHSLKRPNKCVQLETVVPLSPENENKNKAGSEHVKTIAGNLIPCHTVKLTIQIQHFAENYGTKP